MTSPRLTFRVHEVAEQLGVHRSTVARWVTSGALPHVAVNGVRLIRPEQLEAFLAAHTEGDQLARQRHSSTRKRTA
jgi:excisionase family DNA binding protein